MKRFISSLVTAIMAIGLIAGSAVPAQAANAEEDCYSIQMTASAPSPGKVKFSWNIRSNESRARSFSMHVWVNGKTTKISGPMRNNRASGDRTFSTGTWDYVLVQRYGFIDRRFGWDCYFPSTTYTNRID